MLSKVLVKWPVQFYPQKPRVAIRSFSVSGSTTHSTCFNSYSSTVFISSHDSTYFILVIKLLIIWAPSLLEWKPNATPDFYRLNWRPSECIIVTKTQPYPVPLLPTSMFFCIFCWGVLEIHRLSKTLTHFRCVTDPIFLWFSNLILLIKIKATWGLFLKAHSVWWSALWWCQQYEDAQCKNVYLEQNHAVRRLCTGRLYPQTSSVLLHELICLSTLDQIEFQAVQGQD